jgi:tetratricopeptide (TPR) repeat protein
MGGGMGGLNRPSGLGGGAASLPGGGFANRPTGSFPQPGQRPGGLGAGQRPGGVGVGGATTLPGIGGAGGGGRPGLSTRPLDRPTLGGVPTTKPFPQPGLGGGGGGAGGGGMGGMNRPTTLPGQIGGGGAGAGGGNRPGIGGGNRPTTLPGQIGGGGAGGGGGLSSGNRPGFGGGNRPTTLPGQLGDGGMNGSRPGIGGNRPGAFDRPGRPGRPGIGGNRPGIGNGLGNNVGNGIGNNVGSGNNIGNNIGNTIGGNNNFNNINVNGGGWGYHGGGWGYPGGGYGGDWGYGGGWANNWNNGYVNPHYGGWYSGCWNGNWGNNWGGYGYGGGWWAPFAFGAATWGLASTVGGWGLGYGTLGYGSGYVNPYYSSIPAAVVASSPYDYSQPVVVNNYITNDGDLSNSSDAQGGAGAAAAAAPTNNEANAAVDDALAKFKAGDYAGALAGFDRAVKASPKDSVIHEVRALTLFALGRYPEAAATLNSVLVSAPGMDWTTISNVYGSVDAYTAHLRKLEDFCRANPDSASGHFVLAYHYLVGGHADMAAEALKVVVAKQPGDLVAKRLLEAITPPEETKADAPQPADQPASAPQAEAAPAAGPETDLVGTWKATSGKDTVVLTITEDSRFTWKATPAGRPAVELSGTVETARDAIALNTEKAGSMVGNVQSKGSDAFSFTLVGAPKEAKPLEFQRQK